VTSPDELVAAFGAYGGAFVVGAIGSVVPIVSIEVFLVGLTLARAGDAVPLVALATLGQVVGKLPIYAAARGVGTAVGRQRRWIERMRGWVARLGDRPSLVLAASAVLGVPPFSIASTAAGVLAIPPRTFCVVVAAGRALRLSVLILLARSLS
jgi:membrane protein YqaA with SNARE-associated domain